MYQSVNNYLNAVVTVLSSIYFAKITLNVNFSKQKKVVLFCILIISFLFSWLFVSKLTVFKSELCFCLYFILFKFLFSFDIIKSFILTFYYFIILMISEISSISIFIALFGKSIFYEKIAGGVLGGLLVFLFLVIFSLLFRKIINKFLTVKIEHRLILILIISIFLIIKIFYLAYSNGVTIFDQVLCFFCIIIIILIIGYAFLQLSRYQKLLIKYDSLLSFLKQYEMELDNQRVLCHENKNQLLVIKSKLLDNENSDKVVSYINNLINDNLKINHLEYSKFKYLPSNGIRGLFYFKLSIAQDKNINISINISKHIENGFLSKLSLVNFNQLVKILGVYLDNAIESAEVSAEKNIGIEIYEKNSNIIEFIISNTFDSSLKHFGRSTKSHKRGHGLILANNLIYGNSKFSNSVEIIDNLYITKLRIHK